MVSLHECYPIHQTLISTEVVRKKNSSRAIEITYEPSMFKRSSFPSKETRPSSMLPIMARTFVVSKFSVRARAPMSLAMVSYSIVAKVLYPNGCTIVHISVRTGNIYVYNVQ